MFPIHPFQTQKKNPGKEPKRQNEEIQKRTLAKPSNLPTIPPCIALNGTSALSAICGKQAAKLS
jgi:hypothetical protein